MCTATVPATGAEALAMLESALGMQESALVFLAAEDTAACPPRPPRTSSGPWNGPTRSGRPPGAAAGGLRCAGRAPGRRAAQHPDLAGPLARVTKGQAAEYQAIQALARGHQRAARGAGRGSRSSPSPSPCSWPGGPRPIPADCRGKAEEILVAAARAGADLRSLAAICAEIRARTAESDPDDEDDPRLDRGVSLDTTFDGAGVVHGDLTPECTAMVQAVLDALSAPQGGGDLRTRPQRYHDALAEAMKRPAGLGPAAAAGRAAGQGAGPHLLRRAPREGPGRDPAGQVDRASTGPGGPPTAPPTRSAPATAAPGWTATPPARSPSTR